jgi:hypothetical protein
LALFRKALGFGELAATIHHYPSLEMLEQPIFTVEKPKTRLAREYIALSNAITNAMGGSAS